MKTPPSNLPRPTDAEMEILHVLWQLEPATVRQIHEHLIQTKQAQYTTTLKQLQVMTPLLEAVLSKVTRQSAPRLPASQPKSAAANSLTDANLASGAGLSARRNGEPGLISAFQFDPSDRAVWSSAMIWRFAPNLW